MLIDFKRWKCDEAERCGVSVSAIEHRVLKGKYPDLKLVRKSKRSVFVASSRPAK